MISITLVSYTNNLYSNMYVVRPHCNILVVKLYWYLHCSLTEVPLCTATYPYTTDTIYCFFGWPYSLFYAGKPVAVTHSRGRGAKPTPGSDPSFEKTQWEVRRQRGSKLTLKRSPPPHGQNLSTSTTSLVADDYDSDGSDNSDDNAGNNEAMATVTTATDDAFYSMASIASCSYEARQVRFIH
jgi:hypothetical protein